MAADRVATEGLTVWDSEAPAAHPSHAILLRRDRFDALLRRAAESAGVRAFEVAFCAAARRRCGGGWSLPLATAAGDGCVEADFLVDARGRRGGAHRLGAATVALAACWRDAAPMPAATCIEAASDAWAWGGVALYGRQAAACFVDPEHVAGLGAAGRLALYADLLARMRLLRPLLDGPICAPPVVLDPTARFAANIAEPDRIAVGDAAVATEPLSSQGVQRAIVSALQGAAVVHTALTQLPFTCSIF
jgi:flavin-dependent dehydrogenase